MLLFHILWDSGGRGGEETGDLVLVHLFRPSCVSSGRLPTLFRPHFILGEKSRWSLSQVHTLSLCLTSSSWCEDYEVQLQPWGLDLYWMLDPQPEMCQDGQRMEPGVLGVRVPVRAPRMPRWGRAGERWVKGNANPTKGWAVALNVSLMGDGLVMGRED